MVSVYPSGNGAFDNGAFDNGAFDNGAFDNGAFDNGAFDNGAFDNGAFDNGACPIVSIITTPSVGLGYMRASGVSGISAPVTLSTVTVAVPLLLH